MKLRIMTIGGARVEGGRALVLCDDEGHMLPGQSAVVLTQEENETSTITVKFEIDGKGVILDCGPAVD